MPIIYAPEERVQLAVSRGILFDECDRHIIEERSWNIGSHGYAAASYREDGVKTTILLHHRILGKPEPGFVVDHKNRNKLDCRRENMRIVSQSDNMKNSERATIKSVRYIGRHDHFRAELIVGTFLDDAEAEKELDEVLRILREASYKFPHERRWDGTKEPQY